MLFTLSACDLPETTRTTYRHLSSITLITGRIPLELGFGVDIPAKDPSPRKSVLSSHFVLYFHQYTALSGDFSFLTVVQLLEW